MKAIELCAGAGGQALGLEQAGFEHRALIEIEPWPCQTLRLNRPEWPVALADIGLVRGRPGMIDLLAGGIPCPPFSVAGKQLGPDDERDLFPQVLRLADEFEPKAILVENVPGLLKPLFDGYRTRIAAQLESLGYDVAGWQLLQASDFGVPQLRPRVAMIALRPEFAARFRWPSPSPQSAPSVGEALFGEMASRGWKGAVAWRERANKIAPTLVGGSRKHGGPDLGPTRARLAWSFLGVDGKTLAEEPPPAGFDGVPRLTVKMAAILQGFPADWRFAGRKTAAYRQVGNAFPPPVAAALGRAIRAALSGESLGEEAA